METRTVSKLSREVASLSYSEAEILSVVGDKRNVPLEEVSPCMEEVRNLISSCHLALLVVEYPWGVEFELTLSKEGADYLERAPPVNSPLHAQEETAA